MRVIVCGGRRYGDLEALEAELGRLLERADRDQDTLLIVHGGCASGADAMAQAWAEREVVEVETHPADWVRFGNAAGPIRNQIMVSLGADLCVCFPGGKGTLDMRTRCEAAGIPVRTVVAFAR